MRASATLTSPVARVESRACVGNEQSLSSRYTRRAFARVSRACLCVPFLSLGQQHLPLSSRAHVCATLAGTRADRARAAPARQESREPPIRELVTTGRSWHGERGASAPPAFSYPEGEREKKREKEREEENQRQRESETEEKERSRPAADQRSLISGRRIARAFCAPRTCRHADPRYGRPREEGLEGRDSTGDSYHTRGASLRSYRDDPSYPAIPR